MDLQQQHNSPKESISDFALRYGNNELQSNSFKILTKIINKLLKLLNGLKYMRRHNNLVTIWRLARIQLQSNSFKILTKLINKLLKLLNGLKYMRRHNNLVTIWRLARGSLSHSLISTPEEGRIWENHPNLRSLWWFVKLSTRDL